MKRIHFIVVYALLFLTTLFARASAPEAVRPMIWVTDADRAAIVAKIESQPWAKACFDAMKARVADAVAAHQRDPDAYLRGLPLVPNKEHPERHPTIARIGGAGSSEAVSRSNHSLQRYLHIGTDCSVLYYLTDDETYGRCAADILNACVEAFVQMKANDTSDQGGLIYASDVLYDARAIGAQLPILYDFLYARLRAGATVHNLATKQPGAFNFVHAQKVFRDYARLVIEHGQINSNHPVLEMPALALNTLAVDDPAERADLLQYVVSKDTPNQDSLKKVMGEYAKSGGIWPESLQYSNGVSWRVTYLAALLRRQNPPAISVADFAKFPQSILRLTDFRFPNGENIRFGDSPRRAGQPYDSMEVAYAHALREGDAALQQTMGAQLNLAIRAGHYDRAKPQGFSSGADSYQGPLQLLWYAPEISGTMSTPPVKTTDELSFVGAVLQRNLSPDGNPAHALMATVSGGAHVHSHASGMALELYGLGHVLGANAGKGSYGTDDHENHRRLFAANNTVIVNGASQGGGGWVNLAINTVKKVTLEPAVGAAPVSANHSFTLTSFDDDKGPAAQAKQQRLVGLVRTSPTTGYYVDVFRSRSALSPQFHDYLYHNVGDTLSVASADGPLTLKDSSGRFVPAKDSVWKKNRSFLNPGWHVFKQPKTSAVLATDVVAHFSLAKLEPAAAHMRLFIPGSPDRDYSTALAPDTHDAPKPYEKNPTPVLVIRQQGEAWDRPFAVVYEPFVGSEKSGSIQSVTALTQDGKFAGFKIVSKLADATSTQLVLTPSPESGAFTDPALGLSFRGRYAVVTLNQRDECTSLYLGDGSQLSFKGLDLVSSSGRATSASAELHSASPTLRAASPCTLTLPAGKKISSQLSASPTP